MRRTAVLSVLALAAATVGVTAPADAEPTAKQRLRGVTFVGNNWGGTASIVDTRTLTLLKSGVDLVPDKEQELRDIHAAPDRLAFYLAVQQGPGEGHDQYVDDMFSTPDGRYLAVSRPSFGDVVWIDIARATDPATAHDPTNVVREQQMDGYRTDHMGLSPDGRRLLVSDSTEAQVIEFSMVDEVVDGQQVRMGDRLRTFPSGETPHESNYSRDGSRIFHASIGKVYTPGDRKELDALKGDRWFQVVDNSDFSILERWDMGKELAEAGFPGMSSAVRPMAIAPGERTIFFQVSFFHGIVEFDTQAPDIDGAVTYTSGGIAEPRVGAVKRLIALPNRVPDMSREEYVNDSAHHGLSIDQEGDRLCAAGTMDDYVALVNRSDGSFRLYDDASTGHSYAKPYWTTEGPGDTCWVSLSGADALSVIDFRTGRELAYLPVGDHPQRVRHGAVPASVAKSWTDVGENPPEAADNGSILAAVSAILGQLLLQIDAG